MDIRFKKMTRNVFVKTAVFLICLASLCFSVIPFMELIPKADAVSMTLEDMKKGDYLTSDSCFRYKEPGGRAVSARDSRLPDDR